MLNAIINMSGRTKPQFFGIFPTAHINDCLEQTSIWAVSGSHCSTAQPLILMVPFMDGPLKMTCDHKVSALVFWLKKFVIHNAPDFVQNEYIIHNIYSNIFCLFYRNGILICQKKWEVFGAVCDISKFHFCKTNRKYCSTYYYWTNMNL